MTIADRNLVDELTTGEVTLPKLGKVLAAIYIQTDNQGNIQKEQGKTLDRLEKAAEEQKDINSATLKQTTATNGRVTELERKHAGVVSCPGKCIDLEVRLLDALKTLEEHDGRVAKLEEPVKVRGAIWHGVVSSFTGVSAVLALVFGFLYIPGVSEHIFSAREHATEVAVARIVATEMVKQNALSSNSKTPDSGSGNDGAKPSEAAKP